MKFVRKTAQMCSWGISSATNTTTSCSTASGNVMIRKTSMKCGHTSCSERLNALGTEESSRLMSGPTRAKIVPTISPGTTSATDAKALKRIRMASASSRRPQGSVRSTVKTGWAGSPRSTEPTRRSSMPA